MRVLGVDPGGAGALALLSENGMELRVADMPVFQRRRGKGTRTELDVQGLIRLLEGMEFDACYFERVQGMPGDGESSAFNFGRIAGAAEAIVKARGGRFIFVTPPVWKKSMKLIGKLKDDSRAMATDLWPVNAMDFARKKDDGRADAALIAEHGRRELAAQGVFA